MTCFYLILLSLFLFIKIQAVPYDPPEESSMYRPLRCSTRLCSDPPPSHLTPPLDRLQMRIVNHCKLIARVNLQRTQRVLANEYLPVWISNEIVDTDSLHNHDGYGLERDYDVMKQLGEFTTYQDTETSSAAIYFHKRREFDGMIGYGYYIQKLSVDRIDPSEETLIRLDRYGVYSRPDYKEHDEDCVVLGVDPRAGVNYQGHMKTYESRVYDGYPEVLVIVSADVANDWVHRLPRSNWYTTIVSHVLTLFNGIDMLYSKLQHVKIQINIAGIIIEEADSFMFLETCYYSEDTADVRSDYKLDAECVHSLLRTYLHSRKQMFPTDSYDLVIYLTKEDIYLRDKTNDTSDTDEIFEQILGIAGAVDWLYQYRSHDLESILVGTVTYRNYLNNYPTIAHEMAHLMTVRHDRPPFFTLEGECRGKIMKTSGGWCNDCLSWSETSKRSFKLFFSSPNCCTFINEPRSLHIPGRQKMLTSDEQCQCYGYVSAKKFREVLLGFCDTQLHCNGEDDIIQHTVIPMDGTPCRDNKVCWGRRCENVEVYKTLPLLK